MREKGFIPELESLRGIAALMVAAYHAYWWFPGYEWNVIRNGYLMVPFFFILSGFVIARAFACRIVGSGDLLEFIRARFWRLYPLHLTILAVFVLVQMTKAELLPVWPVASNLLMLQGLFSGTMYFNAPSWSISTEFVAYLAFGIIAARIGARRGVFAMLAAGAFLCLLAAGQMNFRIAREFLILECLGCFFLGAWLSFVRVRRIALLPELLLLCIGGLLVFSRPGTWDFAFVPLFAGLIWAVAPGGPGTLSGILRAPALRYLGRISYSIYMVHFLVGIVASHLLHGMGIPLVTAGDGNIIVATTTLYGFLALLAYLCAVIAVASISYVSVEQRFRYGISFKRRLAIPAR